MNTNKQGTSASRRNFLKGGLQAVGGLAVVVSGGVVYQAFDEDIFSPFDGPAYEPWHNWKTEPLSGSLALVQMAILAASPHNTQPWRFRVTDNRIELFADLQRNLGTMDPFRREMWIGFGCALENIALAAPIHGFNASIVVTSGALPEQPADEGILLVAVVTLSDAGETLPTAENQALFAAIPQRHTDRSPYQRERSIPEPLQQAFAEIAASMGARLDLFDLGSGRPAFDSLMNDATQAIIDDPAMVADSQRWFRSTNEAIQTHRDGPTLSAAGLPSAVTLLAKIFPDPSAHTAHQMWADATRDQQLASAPATGTISIGDRYSKHDNVVAGRIWQRCHLLATTVGLSMQPMNQPLEWADRLHQLAQSNVALERLSNLIDSRQWQPTFSFRMGFPTAAAPVSPRRSVQDCLVS
ncbi:Acg family FMN-binding oxidoreductase [Reinekea sp.]|jgi:hypothetical protein|uniref:Acg family FMN-binding oxidoreductase n=1 Tax=Reinekea sp. TaxID=1970455 RepID=UPI002A81B277|nr:twin-arginine translocation signal domain-containing protein [Reinekea sp.]